MNGTTHVSSECTVPNVILGITCSVMRSIIGTTGIEWVRIKNPKLQYMHY